MLRAPCRCDDPHKRLDRSYRLDGIRSRLLHRVALWRFFWQCRHWLGSHSLRFFWQCRPLRTSEISVKSRWMSDEVRIPRFFGSYLRSGLVVARGERIRVRRHCVSRFFACFRRERDNTAAQRTITNGSCRPPVSFITSSRTCPSASRISSPGLTRCLISAVVNGLWTLSPSAAVDPALAATDEATPDRPGCYGVSHRLNEGIVPACVQDHNSKPLGRFNYLKNAIERNRLILHIDVAFELRIDRHEIVPAVHLYSMAGVENQRDFRPPRRV